jgi:hypothetical protein
MLRIRAFLPEPVIRTTTTNVINDWHKADHYTLYENPNPIPDHEISIASLPNPPRTRRAAMKSPLAELYCEAEKLELNEHHH